MCSGVGLFWEYIGLFCSLRWALLRVHRTHLRCGDEVVGRAKWDNESRVRQREESEIKGGDTQLTKACQKGPIYTQTSSMNSQKSPTKTAKEPYILSKETYSTAHLKSQDNSPLFSDGKRVLYTLKRAPHKLQKSPIQLKRDQFRCTSEKSR